MKLGSNHFYHKKKQINSATVYDQVTSCIIIIYISRNYLIYLLPTVARDRVIGGSPAPQCSHCPKYLFFSQRGILFYTFAQRKGFQIIHVSICGAKTTYCTSKNSQCVSSLSPQLTVTDCLSPGIRVYFLYQELGFPVHLMQQAKKMYANM